MSKFSAIVKLSDDELTSKYQHYEALDPSSTGMDLDEFKQLLRQGFNVADASDAEIEEAYKAANSDDSNDGLGEDLCLAEFLAWTKSIKWAIRRYPWFGANQKKKKT